MSPLNLEPTFERMFGLLFLKFHCDFFQCFFFKCSLPFLTLLSMFQILSTVSITVGNVSGASEIWIFGWLD